MKGYIKFACISFALMAQSATLIANGQGNVDLTEILPPAKDSNDEAAHLKNSILADSENNNIYEYSKGQETDGEGHDDHDHYWQKGNHFEGDIVTTYEKVEKHFGKATAQGALRAGFIKDDNSTDTTDDDDGKNETNSRLLSLNADPNELWKTRNSLGRIVIPYIISSDYSSTESSVITSALADLAAKTGVFSFVPYTSQADAIKFFKSGSGCWSQIGRQGGIQTISIDTPGCLYTGTIQHETLHAIGFWHEQSRKDRNSYVSINYDNIINGYEHNFDIQQDSIEGGLGSPYDYSSVMHYFATAFGKKESTCLKSVQVCNSAITLSFKGTGQDGNSNFCLDVTNGQTSLYNGQPIQLYSCGALSYTNQLWVIEPWGTRGSVFKLAKDRSYCLSMVFKSPSDQNNAKLALYKCGSPTPDMKQIFGIFGSTWDSMVVRWEGNNNYCMDREAPNSATGSYNGQKMQLYTCGALNYANQYFKFNFFSYSTGICNQLNSWCSLTSNYLPTINSYGNFIGKSVVSDQDLLQARLMYKCSSPRNLKDFCTPDCQCGLNEGNCKTNSDCYTGLVCTNAGSINVCKAPAPTKQPTLFNNCAIDGVDATCGCNKIIKVQRPNCQSEQMYICSNDSSYAKVRIGNLNHCNAYTYWKPLLGEGFCSGSTDKAHSLAFATGSSYKYIIGYDGAGWFNTASTINPAYTAKIGGKYKKWFTKGGSSPIYLAANTNTCSTASWYAVQKTSLSSGLIYPNYETTSNIKYGCACPYAFT